MTTDNLISMSKYDPPGLYRTFKADFLKLLEGLDTKEMAEHSVLNHHVSGLDYLCVKRDPNEVTYKLYIIDKPCNPNSGWLVNPHSHRYAFTSLVLYGRLQHLRFRTRNRGIGLQHERDWVRCLYSPENGQTVVGREFLRPYQIEHCEVGDAYNVRSDEIHTLKMYDDATPVLLGIVQGVDVSKHSNLYLPGNEYPNMNRPVSIKPRPDQVAYMRDRALDLIASGVY